MAEMKWIPGELELHPEAASREHDHVVRQKLKVH